MVIVWGSRLFGKVDEVPGLSYVSTRFLHLWYMPIIPLDSHLVFAETWKSWESLPIALSIRSVATAWVRATLILAFMLLTFLGGVLWPLLGSGTPLIGMSNSGQGIAFLVAGFLGIAFAITKTMRFQNASYARAEQLALLTGVPDGFFDMLKLIYGQVQTKAEMAEIMARLDYSTLGAWAPRISQELAGFDASSELLTDSNTESNDILPVGIPAPVRWN